MYSHREHYVRRIPDARKISTQVPDQAAEVVGVRGRTGGVAANLPLRHRDELGEKAWRHALGRQVAGHSLAPRLVQRLPHRRHRPPHRRRLPQPHVAVVGGGRGLVPEHVLQQLAANRLPFRRPRRPSPARG